MHAAVVAELRSYRRTGRRAYVRDVTGLEADSGTAPVLVVDRPRWIQANLDGFRQILLPLNAKVIERMKQSNPTMAEPWALGSPGSRWARCSAICRRRSLVSSTRSSRAPMPTHPAADCCSSRRTSSAIERELDVDPADFRLWVCLHEETHRVQFTAVPWLRSYLNDQIAQIVDSAELDPTIVAQMLREAIKRVIEGVGQQRGDFDHRPRPDTSSARNRRSGDGGDVAAGGACGCRDGQCWSQRSFPPSRHIRAKFTVRRQGQGLDKIIRKLLGLDAKMRQYRDGASFCRAVMAEVGMAGLNQSLDISGNPPHRCRDCRPQALAGAHPP